MSLELLFFVGAAVSGTFLVVLGGVYCKMRRPKKPSLDGFEKAEAKPEHEDVVTMPEAADYWPGRPEVSQVTRELQSDHDAVSTFSSAVNALAEPEPKSSFLAIMTRLVQEPEK